MGFFVCFFYFFCRGGGIFFLREIDTQTEAVLQLRSFYFFVLAPSLSLLESNEYLPLPHHTHTHTDTHTQLKIQHKFYMTGSWFITVLELLANLQLWNFQPLWVNWGVKSWLNVVCGIWCLMGISLDGSVCACVCCVCVRERETERKREAIVEVMQEGSCGRHFPHVHTRTSTHGTLL